MTKSKLGNLTCPARRQRLDQGCLETANSPEPEIATHRDTDRRDTDVRGSLTGNTGRGSLHAPPRPGRVLVLTTLPLNAVHSERDGQSTALTEGEVWAVESV